jgi:hypothetical protein
MSIYYNADHVTTPRPTQPKPTVRKVHAGPAWRGARAVLKAAIRNAQAQCGTWVPGDSNSVGDEIIDHIAELDPAAVYLLHIVFADLRALCAGRGRRL